MQIYREKDAIQSVILGLKRDQKSIGFVPTMGALHEGHLSLVKQAVLACDAVVVSIFINPTQFNNPEDLENYPRTLDTDISLLNNLGFELIIFVPKAVELYGEKVEANHFLFDGLEHEMEGKYRPGHFDGVGTIVKKLFEVIQPDKAFFGEKDYQQLQIIRTLTRKAGLPVEIVGCPIHREPNGLARSSRNERLSPQMRSDASFIYQILLKVREKFGAESAKNITDWVREEFEYHPFLRLEYFEIADVDSLKATGEKQPHTSYRAFIAAYAGEVRLIDNIALN